VRAVLFAEGCFFPETEDGPVSTAAIPQLITSGVIASELNRPLHQVLHILATRGHIRPVARAGTLRLYSKRALAQVRYELTLIDARRCRRQEVAI
jgi:hypothetical protein